MHPLTRQWADDLARFVAEYFREPDAQLSEFAVRTGLSMGQWLSLPLLVVGVVFLVRALVRPPLGAAKQA